MRKIQPRASWLSERVLLAVGASPPTKDRALEVKTLSLDGLARSDGFADSGVLMVVRVPNKRAASKLPHVFEDLRSLCRSRLAVLTPEARQTVLALLVESLLWDLPPLDKMRLATSLRQVREALRERLPLAAESEPGSRNLRADAVVRVDDSSFFLTGAMRSDAAALESLVAVSPEGSRTELAGQIFSRASRTRDALSGFAAYFSLPVPSLLPEGWTLEMRGAGAEECEAPLPLLYDLARSRRSILDQLADGPVDDRVMDAHISPALSRLQAERRSQAACDRVVQFGKPAKSTDVSILVTLDADLTMLEHQLAQLARDPDLTRADLMYVLDSDSPGDSAFEKAAHLHDLYRVPFRLVTLVRQAGFAAATDIGVSLARGRLIVLLGSLVLPDRPGWCTSLASFHDAHKGVGAVGAKLLGPNARAAKRSAAVTRGSRVQTVSASCLMIDRARLKRLGGLSGAYVMRDVEAADLCHRLQSAGLDIWSCPDVELYDLSRGRADRAFRAAQVYDEWVYTKAWKSPLG